MRQLAPDTFRSATRYEGKVVHWQVLKKNGTSEANKARPEVIPGNRPARAAGAEDCHGAALPFVEETAHPASEQQGLAAFRREDARSHRSSLRGRRGTAHTAEERFEEPFQLQSMAERRQRGDASRFVLVLAVE